MIWYITFLVSLEFIMGMSFCREKQSNWRFFDDLAEFVVYLFLSIAIRFLLKVLVHPDMSSIAL